MDRLLAQPVFLFLGVVARFTRETGLALAQPVAEPVAGAFDGAELGFEVDVYEAEAGFVAFRPFEIVHEGPGEVAFDVDAFFFSAEDCQ